MEENSVPTLDYSMGVIVVQYDTWMPWLLYVRVKVCCTLWFSLVKTF